MKYSLLLTIDVEDWFQVENFKQCIPFSSWPECELRVEKNVHKILDLLDSVNTSYSSPLTSNGSDASPTTHDVPNASPCSMPYAPCGSVKATFFVLGWIAERLPNLVREIQVRGHELASHGYCHKLCKELSAGDLKFDLTESKKLLEDITGTAIYGYRAPNFSIDQDILKIIEDSGYLYDSSYNSYNLNKRYGQVNFRKNDRNGISIRVSDKFYELPISNLVVGKRVFHWGGGGYFRLYPYRLFNQGVKLILKRQKAHLLYLHPWEVDPDQPRVTGASTLNRFRHYTNLGKTLGKLRLFIESFKECHFQTCYQYLVGVHN